MCWEEENITRSEVDSMVNDAISNYRSSYLEYDVASYLRRSLNIQVENSSNPDCPSLIVSLYLDESLLSQSYVEVK